MTHFHSKINKICTRCKIQFSEQHVLYCTAVATCSCHIIEYTLLTKLNFTSGTYFVDIATDMYQLYLLQMVLLRAETFWSNTVLIKWCE